MRKPVKRSEKKTKKMDIGHTGKSQRITFTLSKAVYSAAYMRARIKECMEGCGKVEGLNIDVVDSTK